MTTPASAVSDRALQLGGPGSVAPIVDGDLFSLPLFEEAFDGGYWQKASGPVVMRYPTFGDEVEVERQTIMRGGTVLARAQAAIAVCLKSAPASWYRPDPMGGSTPVLALDRLPCSVELIGLFQRWLLWRDSFRRKDEGETGGETV